LSHSGAFDAGLGCGVLAFHDAFVTAAAAASIGIAPGILLFGARRILGRGKEENSAMEREEKVP